MSGVAQDGPFGLTTQAQFEYAGSELTLFASAHNWKSYWAKQICPLISGDVLEVGAGMGANTAYLHKGAHREWVCLEPDSRLVSHLKARLKHGALPRDLEVVCGTIEALEPSRKFDTIIYIDVLEHVPDDRAELELAASRLRPGGRLIVLSPAHQWLFSPFDAAIGHFRRYNRPMLRRLSPALLELQRVWYLDSVGLALSSANRLLLKQSMPAKGQLRLWDRCIVPMSRLLDRLFFESVGKSVIAVWRRKE